MPAAASMNHMLEKLQRLPPDRVIEVEDFIDFLVSRDVDRPLVKAAQAVTTNSLKAVWDNADDAEYDRL